MNRRPSRVILVLGRWALMAGLAGLVLSSLALLDRWRAPDNLDAQHNLLITAAVLLSLSFVLAPFVRRAFLPPSRRDQRKERKTLLDEMRERPDSEWQAAVAEPSMPEPRADDARPLLTGLIVGIYLVFGAVLAAILVALR